MIWVRLVQTTPASRSVEGKMVPRWHGPCKVIRKLSDVTYEVQGVKVFTCHIERMKRYRGEEILALDAVPVPPAFQS